MHYTKYFDAREDIFAHHMRRMIRLRQKTGGVCPNPADAAPFLYPKRKRMVLAKPMRAFFCAMQPT